jgi:hypothetical protein
MPFFKKKKVKRDDRLHHWLSFSLPVYHFAAASLPYVLLVLRTHARQSTDCMGRGAIVRTARTPAHVLADCRVPTAARVACA